MYTSLEQLQADLDEWLLYYNRERTYSGRYCDGRTPMQTWRDTQHLAQQKRLEKLMAQQVGFAQQQQIPTQSELPTVSTIPSLIA